MKIYNNIDGQARLVENIADGVNTDDAASVGQVISGVNNVVFVGGVNSYTVWNQTNYNTNVSTSITKTSLFSTRHTLNCSYVSDGTSDVFSTTELGYFRAVFTGTVRAYVTYSGTALRRFYMYAQPYITDSTNKSVILAGNSEYTEVFNYMYDSNDDYLFYKYHGSTFQHERIFNNTSGTLKIGAYMNCILQTLSSTNRRFDIVYPKLIITKL